MNIINRETIAYLFYEKQKLTIMRIRMKKIPGFHGVVPLAHNISHPIFKAILKYANHPSTSAMKDLNNTSMLSCIKCI